MNRVLEHKTPSDSLRLLTNELVVHCWSDSIFIWWLAVKGVEHVLGKVLTGLQWQEPQADLPITVLQFLWSIVTPAGESLFPKMKRSSLWQSTGGLRQALGLLQAQAALWSPQHRRLAWLAGTERSLLFLETLPGMSCLLAPAVCCGSSKDGTKWKASSRMQRESGFQALPLNMCSNRCGPQEQAPAL